MTDKIAICPKYGARTELFAIGSILYFMLRGYEPYEDTCLDVALRVFIWTDYIPESFEEGIIKNV